IETDVCWVRRVFSSIVQCLLCQIRVVAALDRIAPPFVFWLSESVQQLLDGVGVLNIHVAVDH
ncbi:hypothetical protein FIBSPDRAFT_878380, partial [Athelia psychrophila]